MELKDSSINYWFTIEPYVFVGFHENKALLYNTLDGSILKSDKTEVIKLNEYPCLYLKAPLNYLITIIWMYGLKQEINFCISVIYN